MTFTGDLREVDVKTLFFIIDNLRITGKLLIKDSFSEYTVYFKNGKPVNAEGEKDPTSAIEKIIGLENASFEVIKIDKVPELETPERLSDIISQIDTVSEQWRKIKNQFISQNIIITLSESKNNNEIKISGDEWKMLSFIKESVYLSDLIRQSPFGELKTLLTISSLNEKKLVSFAIESEDKLKEEDNIIPIKTAGWFATNTVIYGDRNIEFYRKIDNKKDFVSIVKEIGISYKEGRDILKYLVSQGKITLRKKSR
jgi:hypothetical protein